MVIVNIIYSGLGGHASVAFTLVEADKEKKYQYKFIFFGIEDMPGSYINKCKDLGIEFYFIKKKPGIAVGSQRAVLSILRRIKPDVVLLHSVSLIFLLYYFKLTSRIVLIPVEHQANHLKIKREWIWTFFIMISSKRVVYLTDLYSQQIKKKLGFLYNEKKVSVINNGINMAFFMPLPNNNIGTDRLKMGMFARLSHIKDHVTLIRAFGQVCKQKNNATLELHIAGEGEKKAELQKEVENLKLTNAVFFRGMVEESMAPSFFNEMTIYIHASLGETMSTSIMQAMACGKPMIVSDVEGINNMVVANETALLVPVQDVDRLTDAIKQLINDQPLQKRLSEAAIAYAQQYFSSQTMFEKYERLFT